jgi:hypothetical protein
MIVKNTTMHNVELVDKRALPSRRFVLRATVISDPG